MQTATAEPGQIQQWDDAPAWLTSSRASQAEIDAAFADEPEPKVEIKPVEGLTPRQSAWFNVLTQLGEDYPLSEYAKMSDEASLEIALNWAKKMPNVLPADMDDVYSLARQQAGTFVPQLNHFEMAWGRLAAAIADRVLAQRHAEHGRMKADAADIARALHQGKAPLFVQHHRALGPAAMLFCECPEQRITDAIRFRPSAQMMTVQELYDVGRDTNYPLTNEHYRDANLEVDAPRFWVCREGKCGYFHDAYQPLPKPKSEPAPVESKTPARPKVRAFVQQVVEAWNLDPAQMTDLLYAELTSFCRWWREEYPGLPTSSDYETYGPAWKASLEAKAAQREAVAA